MLTKLKTIQESVSTGEREFAEDMKDTVLFYLIDIKKDLREALNRIEDSLSKAETLTKIIEKCERKGVLLVFLTLLGPAEGGDLQEQERGA